MVPKNKPSFRDRVKQRAKDAEKKGGNSIFNLDGKEDVFIKPKKSMQLDILPYKVGTKNLENIPTGEEWFRRQYYVHFNIGQGTEKKKVVCPKTWGEPCPICEYRADLFKNKAPKEETDALRPQLREIYNVIDRSDEDNGTIMLLDVPYGNFGKKLDEEIRENKNEEVAAFAYLDGGYTLEIRFSEESYSTGNGEKINYMKASRVDFAKRDYAYPEETLDNIYDLNTVFNSLTYEGIRALFLGMEAGEPEEAEEEKPKATRVQRTVKKEPEEVVEEPEEVVEEPEEVVEEVVEDPVEITEGECPYGGEFGTDCNDLSECDKCENWEACADKKDELKKEKKEKPVEKKAEPAKKAAPAPAKAPVKGTVQRTPSRRTK